MSAPYDRPVLDEGNCNNVAVGHSDQILEFGGADAADMDSDIDGREMKEDAYLSAVRTIKEAQAEGKVSPAILKQAFAQLKNK